MKTDKALVFGLILIVALVAALAAFPASSHRGGYDRVAPSGPAEGGSPDANTPKEGVFNYSISASADKHSYKSNEEIKFAINVTVPEKSEDLEVRIHGVKNRYGAEKIKVTIKPALEAGGNALEAIAKVPSCYGCSAINPGVYNITVGLYREDALITETNLTVEITK